jgi:hypothetical protein
MNEQMVIQLKKKDHFVPEENLNFSDIIMSVSTQN